MGAGTVDVIVLVFLGGLFLLGVIRGFVHQLAGILFLVVGIFVARRFYSDLAAVLRQTFDIGEPVDWIAAFAAILVGVIVVGALIAILMRGVLDKLKLLAYDRFLGGVLGALKGALIVVLVLNVVMDLRGGEGATAGAIDESISWSVAKPVMERALPLLPESFRTRLREYREELKERENAPGPSERKGPSEKGPSEGDGEEKTGG